ncbi:MAG TPA: DUF4199 domain-containing protein [Salinivirgaceae bacterium]|nr:DUF4199 domain-containing protein [Salinivirgaceae bacterium]
MVNDKKNTLNSYCAKHGAIVGAVLILLTFIFYLSTGKINDSESYAGTASTIMTILGLFFFTRQYRKSNPNINFTYGTAFKTSFLIGLYSSLIVAFFNYLFYKFSPDAVNEFLLATQNAYLETELYTESQIESLISLLQKFLTPGVLAFSMLLGLVVSVAIYSLIIAAFLQSRKPNIQKDTSAFDKDMSEIE